MKQPWVAWVAWVLVGVVACQSAGAPQPLGNQKQGPSPHSSRDELIRVALAAAAEGRAEDLVALAGLGEIFETVLDCPPPKRARQEELIRSQLTEAAANARGLTIDVLATERDERAARNSKAAGERLGRCEVKRTFERRIVHVRLRVREAGKEPRETVERIHVTEIGGRWYLTQLPARIADPAHAVLTKVEGFADRICACKDKACADAVNDEYTKWGVEMAAKAPPDERPDPDVIKRMTEAATRYTECYTKLAMAAAGNPP